MEQESIELIKKLKGVLDTVRQNSDQDDFLKKPGRYLGPAIKIYADFLKKVKLSSFAVFIKVVGVEGKTNYSLQCVLEELWELEETWDDFLKTASEKKATICLFLMKSMNLLEFDN